MRFLFLSSLIVSFLVCACAPPDPGIATVFDPCASASIVAGAGTTPSEQAAVSEAVALWRVAADVRLGTSGTPDAPGALRIEFQDAAPMFYGVYDDERGVISVNHRLPTESARTITIAHEIGHAFGLEHVSPSERRSIMNPHNLDVTLTTADVSALTALWGSCAASSLD